MAGPLEELADGDAQRVGDGGDRRGARVDAGPLGAGDSLSKKPAPLGNIGQTQAPRLSDALDGLHRQCVNDNVTIVKTEGVREGTGRPFR
jgi:hypothetical protein